MLAEASASTTPIDTECQLSTAVGVARAGSMDFPPDCSDAVVLKEYEVED
jgi:hypothetical protein